MDLPFFFRGFLLAVTIAAPVGPTGVLCMQRTLSGGRWYGFVSGLGASTAHAIFGSIAAFGLTFISTFLAEHQFWFRLSSGMFICYLGTRVFLLVPVQRITPVRGIGYVGGYASIFLLTLLNPITALFFVAVFPVLGHVGQGASYASAGTLVLGVFTGSTLWWFALSILTSIFRQRVSPSTMRWVNRISGVMIIVFGVMILFSLTR
jgi:threonine/homoserine/homoserine lactone efflux protein